MECSGQMALQTAGKKDEEIVNVGRMEEVEASERDEEMEERLVKDEEESAIKDRDTMGHGSALWS